MWKTSFLNELHKWFSAQETPWSEQSTAGDLKILEQSDLNKAVVTLQAPTHIATITLWGNGILEFIAFDLASKSEVFECTKEFSTPETLAFLLKSASVAFANLLRSHQQDEPEKD